MSPTVTAARTPLRRDPVLIALGVVALMAFGIAAADSGGQIMPAVTWPALVLLCGVAAVSGFRIWRSPDNTLMERRTWGSVGLAAAIFLVSDAWQFGVYLREPASMAAAIGGPVYSVGIFVGTLCMVVTLLVTPVGFAGRQARVRFLLDAATVLVFAATLGCYFTVTAGAAGIAGAGRLISLLFGPAIYMVAMFALIKLFLMPVKPFTPLAGTLMSVAAALEGAATGFRPLLITHGHIPWQQAATVIAVAALAAGTRVQQVQMRSGGPRRTWASRRPYSLLPYAAVVGTFGLLIGVLAITGWQDATWILVAGAATSSGLVVVRQVTAFAELHETLAERDRLASELEYLAFHDALTGLANRAFFQRHLDDHEGECAVLLIDLDGFKPINDTYGHAAGDAVLTAVGMRLRANAGPGEVVARLGGDEFALFSTVPLTGDRVAALAAAIEVPMTVLGQDVRVGASIGMANGFGDAALLHQADLAMYEQKGGKPGVRA